MTRIVTIDFETYWSSKEKYSLSKMGPIEYIRDERFFVQCVAVRVDHGPVEVMDHKHGIDLEKYHLERSDTITVGHNISGFDALVLSEHYGIKPHCCIDTIALCHWLGISRISNVSHKAITKLLGHGTKQEGTAVSDGLRTLDEFSPEERVFFLRYCHDDTLQCSENFFAMYNAMDDGKGKLDALITMMFTARMATHPAFVPDLGMLYDYVNKLDAGSEAARSKLAEFMHFATAKDMIKAIRSRSEFPKLLEQLGCKCPMKFSEKQGKNIPAISKTDLEFKKLLNHPDERVRTLVSIRLEQNSSIQRSRAVNIINLGHKPIPIPLCAFKAHTGRYTAGSESEVSDGLNFQNLSKRDPNMLTIRKSIKAPKGHKVLACDSSQIEARMLAWVAGQDDLVAQFKSGADPYAEMAAKIFHTDAKAIHDAAKNNDDPNHNRYKMYRNVGKTCILSCLAADTEVLTDMGWKPIIMVSETDKLWDGTQWVNHSGLIFNGKKKTINVDGVRMTQDHMVLCGSSWRTASECIETRSFLSQALSTGTESSETLQSTGVLNTFASASIAGRNTGYQSTVCPESQSIVRTVLCETLAILNHLRRDTQTLMSETRLANSPLCATNAEQLVTIELNGKCLSNAHAGQNLIGCYSAICGQEKLQDVTPVPRKKHLAHIQNSTVATPIYAQTAAIDADCSTEYPLACNAALTQMIETIRTMAVAVSNVCSRIVGRILNICSRLMAGTINISTSTESTTTETMNPAISDLLQSLKTLITSGMCRNSKKKSTDCENVYDISNAGENHRFMIRTNSGTMIVHNCGYGVGAQKFSDTLLRSGVKLDDDESKHLDIARMAHRTYRDNSQAIVNLWGICDRVLSDMLFAANRKEIVEGYAFGAHNLLKWGVKYIPCTSILSPYVELPNGYCLWYPNLRSNGDGLVYDRFVHGKVTETKIYGGALTENCIQALAFAMLSWQACRVFMCGVPINCNIHDAWIAVVPDAIAYKCQGIIERYMSSTPMWLSGFPVDCECEVGTDFTIA